LSSQIQTRIELIMSILVLESNDIFVHVNGLRLNKQNVRILER